ncbi:4-coumarate-CoA ligase [Mycena rosella]|uniref:4-coumarate-CoA ligase n=1 Tax=Mycena rosella TaxID=1033263 RepID=A0AAD7CW16_MYCRO|nr:4-coumarate-CoA ligase [Mycena rosella]
MLYTGKPTGPIPQLDLLTFLFDSPYTLAAETTVIHAEAANPSNAITKASARQLTRRMAHTLRERFGIGKNGAGKDIVLVVSTGQILVPILFLAVIAAGGVASLASPSYKKEELAKQIEQGPPSYVYLAPLLGVHLLISAASLNQFPLDRCLVLDSAPSQWRLHLLTDTSARNIIGELELDWERITAKEELENSLISLLWSSGLQARPKVHISHTNIVAATAIEGGSLREHWKRAGKWEYRTLAHLPTAHIAGNFILCSHIQRNNTVTTGGCCFWMPTFNFEKFLAFNKSLRITTFLSVPPIFLLISKSPLVQDHFRALKVATSGAAPLGKELQIGASKKLGVFLAQTWGLTETTGSVSGGDVGFEDLSGSVGPLLSSHLIIFVRIIDDSDNDCPPNTPGEIIVQGPIVTKGYHNNPEANAEAFKDGFFRTGDIGFIQNERLYIVDRKKELIKYKGLQVAPAELEAVLLSHPHILDAAVIGIYDEKECTEVPRAYVVADKTVIGATAIQEFVKNRLASHKQVRGGVEYVNQIPKSAAGKILRKEIRAIAQRSTKKAKL